MFVRILNKLISYSRKNLMLGVTFISYIWIIIFCILPLFLIVKISLSQDIFSIPPFSSISSWENTLILTIKLNFNHYKTIFTNPFYSGAFKNSIFFATLSTTFILIIGYWIAYGIYKTSPKKQNILLLLTIIPFFTSFLIRIYAWMNLLSNKGLLNVFLMKIGLIKSPLLLLNGSFAVTIGMVYCYLPFMVFPIYSILKKNDQSYIEAASDLGCTPFKSFWLITFPLSMPGIVTGVMLVFIPIIGEFVIPEILGGATITTIGRAIWWEFFDHHNWPLACSLAITMSFILIIPLLFFYLQQKKHNK
ncbi:MAG: ABC transporter permease [Alphaproteobacteria bacterium]